MTDIQRQEATRVVMTFDGVMLDNDHMRSALYSLFMDNIMTPEELSREIKVFTGVDVSALMLKYAAQDIFISMTKGGRNNGK